MFKQLIRQALRSLIKQRKTTLITILGLFLAVLTILLISAWLFNEYSYDTYHSKSDRIYRMTIETGRQGDNNYWHFARCWQIWRRELPEYFPEVEQLVEIAPTHNTVVTVADEVYNEEGFAVKPNFFDVFDFHFVLGNGREALKNPHTIALSQSICSKYFGNESPLGKTLKLDGEYIDTGAVYTVTGVYKDMPFASHFHANFLVSYHEPVGMNKMEWAYTYVLLKQGADIDRLRTKLPEFIETYVPADQKANLTGIHFMPLTDIHLKSNIEREIEPNGDIRHTYMFSSIVIGLFLLALINYINLQTVLFEKRRVSFRMNQLVGAKHRHNLIIAFMESTVIGLMAISLALVCIYPAVVLIHRTGLVIPLENKGALFNRLVIVGGILWVLISITGILPYQLLKNLVVVGTHRNNSVSRALLSKSGGFSTPLIILQFSLAIFVIVASLVVRGQNQFMFSKNLGGKADNILVLYRNFWSEEEKVQLLGNVLRSNSQVEAYAAVLSEPSYLNKDARRVKTSAIPGGFTDFTLTIEPTDETFFDLFNIPIMAGRTMKTYISGQKYEEYVLNESAVRKLGFKKPVDVIGIDFTVQPIFEGIIHGGTVVGVVKDFNSASLYHPIQPTVYFQKPIWQGTSLVKLTPGVRTEQIKELEASWKTVFPNYPFEYRFLSEVYQKAYQKDILINRLLNLFSILCLVISGIGLWGFSSVILIHRTREIGIRKTNGANVRELLVLVNSRFIKWILIAWILACPVAWYIMSGWLQHYAYHITIRSWIFVAAGLMVSIIAILAVSFQSWKAATKNPVESLCYE